MYFVGVPLLIVPFAIYNIFAFIIPGVTWNAPIIAVTLYSGAEWQISPGDILITVSILILLVELVKLTRLGVRSWVDHLLSFLLFAAMTAEFTMVQAVATPTFFLLLVIAFVDFVGGVVSGLAARARRRELMAARDMAPGIEPVTIMARRTEPTAEPNLEPPAVKPEPKPAAEPPVDTKPPAAPSQTNPV